MKKCLNCEKELIGRRRKYCSDLCMCYYYEKNNQEKVDEYRRTYRKEHSKKNIKYQKGYREKNKDLLLEQKKEYYKENKEKILNQKKIYKRKRRKEDPMFRMGLNFSRNISHSLKSNKVSKKRKHWENLVGYKSSDLKNHLEKLFKPGMSWDNYGLYGWHIDHIIPRSFFRYNSMDDVEFKYCWSLNNLQPLWASDNLSKNNRIMKKYLRSE